MPIILSPMNRIPIWKERIEERLRELLRTFEPKHLSEAMSYYLFQPGKRIRPLLTVATAVSLGGDQEDAITAGCAIEIIHNYSLVHDDLPAMDNDDFRRGLPSCHRKFGEAVAILAGDAMLTYAFELLSRKGIFRSLTEGEVISLIHTIAVKSGAEGMVGGQALDISGERDLEKVNLKKTAALFEACFLSGGIVAHRHDLLPDLEGVGRSFGLLFQITDDIVDRDGYYLLLREGGAKKKASQIHDEVKTLVDKVFKGNSPEIEFLVEAVYKRIT